MEVKHEAPKLDYRTPPNRSADVGLGVSIAWLSIAVFAAVPTIVVVGLLLKPNLTVIGRGYFAAIGLTGIGTILGLGATIFGSRRRRIAMTGFLLNAIGIILLLWPLVNGW